MVLPPATARLFAHWDLGSGTAGAGDFVALRLAEEGDRADLCWLLALLGEDGLRRCLRRHGTRQLSRRSHSFWSLVLDLPEPARGRPGEELWPH